MTEMILAVPTARLGPPFCVTGFHPCRIVNLIEVLKATGLWIGPRESLERDTAFRQIIPYVLLRIEDRFVCYVRATKGKESRLHGRRSIGMGGHLELSDIVVAGNCIDIMETLNRGARREVAEELGEVECIDRTWQGLVVDNDTDVGRVHIGVVCVWTLGAVPSGVADAELEAVEVYSLEDLRSCRKQLERWSRLVVDCLPSGIERMGDQAS